MAEILSFSTLIVCFIAILTAVRFFGKNGLFVYSAIVAIASNLQVLKLTKYVIIDNPVALGTVLFSTVFAVDNILTEYYGAETAKKNVWLSFFGYLFFVTVMKIAVLHPPVTHGECVNLSNELKSLFSPCFVLFISSLVSYLISQFSDIFIFSTLKKITRGKYVSSRSLISMALSAFIDNCVFSVLAWVILADNPISWSSLWTTYIFITYLLRLFIAVLCVPLVRLAGVLVFKRQNV